MKNEDQIRKIVREKYSGIAAGHKGLNASGCCEAGAGNPEGYNIIAADYTQLQGYDPEADLGLGCGLPTQFAKIRKGDLVIDLGSGAGNDAFVARHETGETGKVIGIDFTPEMITKAKRNAEVRGFHNVEFRQGDIEKMPVTSGTADVIVSNCVLNLVPDKDGVLKEIYRVLKPGGHFSISDIVLAGDLSTQIKEAAEMYAGCVAGAIQLDEYLGLIKVNGFENITVQTEKFIIIPENILGNYLSPENIGSFKNSGTGIKSVTVYGSKPVVELEAC